MPRKIIKAVVFLKNTFASEFIAIVLAKYRIKLLASTKNTSQTLSLLEDQKPNLFICEDDVDTINLIVRKHLKANPSVRNDDSP